MKSVLVTITALTTFFTSLWGQWEVINEGYAFRLIDFVSRDVGWMVTEDTILKTIDGGETWVPDTWNIGEDFFGYEYINVLDFVNDSVGWISMRIGSWADPNPSSYGLFKTIDGGKNWSMQKEGNSLELVYVSEGMVIVSYGYERMSKSTDGGLTWADITPAVAFGNHLVMSFVNSDTGLAIYKGGYAQNEFIRTFDGGKTWHHTTLPEFKHISEIGFIDNLNGYFVARRSSDIGENRIHVICKTEDAFDTWTVVAENQYPVHSCHFFNSDDCIALMEDSIGCNILTSNDGGHTWVDTESIRIPGNPSEVIPYKFNFLNSSDGIIYSEFATYNTHVLLLKSIDRGDSWSMLNLSYPFNDVCFTNAEEGLIVGGWPGPHHNSGDILGTVDGGSSWVFRTGRLCALTNLNFVNDSTGFTTYENCGFLNAGRYSTNLFQTTDGGNSWNEYAHDFNQFTRLKFLNEHLGFAGNDSGIYITNNGGSSWDVLLSSEVSDSFYLWDIMATVVASDERTFWAISGDRSALRFTSDGAWEGIDLETEQDLYKIFFKDEYTGWIASGGYWANWDDPDPQTMFKTEDGGESWLKMDYPYQFRDMFFTDSLYGWAVGMDSLRRGAILETTNGGEDWTVQVDSLSAPLNGIDYKDSIVWAVGEHGLILKMCNSTYVSVIEYQNTTIENNSSLHLYPNPTKSILNIETDISGQYAIELRNLNGQLLLTTVLTGPYQQIDLSSFQKGVYFITIRSKNQVTTRKILKL